MTARIETHPYNLYHPIPARTKLLIVGTAPPPTFSKRPWNENPNSWDFDFFYGSEKNWMWTILDSILGHSSSITEEMNSTDCKTAAKKLLKCNNVWMRDVLQRYSRKNERSSDDKDFNTPNEKDFTDFRNIFIEGPEISALAFTSQTAARWSIEALGYQQLADATHLASRLDEWALARLPNGDRLEAPQFYLEKHSKKFARFKIGARPIDLYVLPTPVGRGPRGLTIPVKIKIYSEVLKKVAAIPLPCMAS